MTNSAFWFLITGLGIGLVITCTWNKGGGIGCVAGLCATCCICTRCCWFIYAGIIIALLPTLIENYQSNLEIYDNIQSLDFDCIGDGKYLSDKDLYGAAWFESFKID